MLELVAIQASNYRWTHARYVAEHLGLPPPDGKQHGDVVVIYAAR
jgi:hypothetical protein